LHSERPEEILGNANAVEILRVAPAGEGKSGEGLRGKFREILLLVTPSGKARPGNIRAIEAALRGVVEARDVKPGRVFQPVRVAIAGSTVSPGIFESVALLGRDETLARIDAALRRAG